MAKAGQGGLEAIAAGLPRENKGLPPVERWNPPFCGDIDMRIGADVRRRRFSGAHDHVFQFFQTFAARLRHDSYSFRRPSEASLGAMQQTHQS